MAKQPTVIAFSPLIARQLRATVAEGSAYEDISEFVEVAVANQLALEAIDDAFATQVSAASPAAKAALAPVSRRSRRLAATYRDALLEPLSPFTNRLFPTKLACRVLANCEQGISLREFQNVAAEAARLVGRRTRQQDENAHRRGFDRRWIALPVGDKTSSLDRFVNHFSLTATRRNRPAGPMVSLGLAALEEDQPMLTELGLAMAEAPNPVIDGLDALDVVGQDEFGLFVKAIDLNRPEVNAILEFARIIEEVGGDQAEVDSRYLSDHPSWSPARAASHRAALCGRLHDLGLASIKGERGHARISLGELPSSWTSETG